MLLSKGSSDDDHHAEIIAGDEMKPPRTLIRNHFSVAITKEVVLGNQYRKCSIRRFINSTQKPHTRRMKCIKGT